MKLAIYLLVLSSLCHAQTAISALTSFWDANVVASDRLLWDYKGTAHGMYVGNGPNLPASIFSGGFARPAGTQTPFNSGVMSVPGALINTGTGSFAYAVWCRRSATDSDYLLARATGDGAVPSWFLSFNTTHPKLTYGMTDDSQAAVIDTSTDVNSGELALIWMAYDAATGKVKVAGNAASWTEATPAAPFRIVSGLCTHPSGIYDPPYPCTLDFSHYHNQFFPTGSPVIGRTMFWNGYIPTDAERIAIYNSGAGRDYSYFGIASLSHLPRPLTVSLINSSFANDSGYADDYKGLYWLRPYPLKLWSPSLAAIHGDYVWIRSTDHALPGIGFPDGNVMLGYSSSPEVLPTVWSQLSLTYADVNPWDDAEGPWMEYDPVTLKFHLYANSEQSNSSNPVQQATHVWTSSDLSAWTWRNYFHPVVTGCPSTPATCYNHTGYAQIIRNRTGDWTALTLLDSAGELSNGGIIRSGLWTSTDGLAWTKGPTTEMMVPIFPYRSQQNQRVPLTTNGPSPPWVKLINSNYVSLPYSQFEGANPWWPLFLHDGACTEVSPPYSCLQDVRTYEEGGAIWVYAKWSSHDPSTTRLYKGHYITGTQISGKGSVSGKASIQ